jgi:hypothetical protein
LALLMLLVWVHHYVSVEYRFIVLAFSGLYLVHRWKPDMETGSTLTWQVWFIWLPDSCGPVVSWQNLAICSYWRSNPRRVPDATASAGWHTAMILVGGCSAWLLDSRCLA